MAFPPVYCPCCCPEGKGCYQRWTVIYLCCSEGGGGWGTPVAGAKRCLLATDAVTSWTKSDTVVEGGCEYVIDVPMKKCCTSDGDCSGLPDTTAPAVPTDPPDDCCSDTDKHCYERWHSTYDCETDEWLEPVSAGLKCLAAADASTDDWTPDTDVTGACTYKKDVLKSTCCESDGDCIGSTTAPAKPDFTPDCCNCNPCANAWDLVLDGVGPNGPPTNPGYVKGFTDPTTFFKTITYHGCDGEGVSTVTWTFNETFCEWMQVGTDRIPDFIHNEPCTTTSNTEWSCTGEQIAPCDTDAGDKITLSDPVTCPP